MFRLALASGYWVVNPDAMMRQMPWRVYQEWLQFSEEEPFGEMPLRLGYAAAQLGNLVSKPKYGSGWETGQFMPYGAPGTKSRQVEDGRSAKYAGKSADQQAANFLAFAREMNIPVNDKRKK